MDQEVLGTEFYLMEFVDGRHFDEPYIEGVNNHERHAM
jgi:hypothetical protein